MFDKIRNSVSLEDLASNKVLTDAINEAFNILLENDKTSCQPKGYISVFSELLCHPRYNIEHMTGYMLRKNGPFIGLLEKAIHLDYKDTVTNLHANYEFDGEYPDDFTKDTLFLRPIEGLKKEIVESFRKELYNPLIQKHHKEELIDIVQDLFFLFLANQKEKSLDRLKKSTEIKPIYSESKVQELYKTTIKSAGDFIGVQQDYINWCYSQTGVLPSSDNLNYWLSTAFDRDLKSLPLISQFISKFPKKYEAVQNRFERMVITKLKKQTERGDISENEYLYLASQYSRIDQDGFQGFLKDHIFYQRLDMVGKITSLVAPMNNETYLSGRQAFIDMDHLEGLKELDEIYRKQMPTNESKIIS